MRRPRLTLDEVDEEDLRNHPHEQSKETDLGSASKEEDVQNAYEMSDFGTETRKPALDLNALKGRPFTDSRKSKTESAVD